jgi:uncharacterized protein YggE
MSSRVIGPLAAVLALVAGTVAAQEPARRDEPAIVTSGQAVVRRPPDRAFLSASVEVRARNPGDAQRQNAEAMATVQQRLAAAGVTKDALQTVGFSIQQEFDFIDGRRISRGYLARNGVEVRVDAIERAGELLDLIVQAGATSVSGIRFDLRDRAAAEREALRLAVVDARGRADAAAEGAGRTVDRVLRIEDHRDVPPQVPVPLLREAAQVASPATPVAPGEIEIRANVTLTVSIR